LDQELARYINFGSGLTDGKVEDSIASERSLNEKLCATIFELDTASEPDKVAIRFRGILRENPD
jgi:hypothetical protein